MTNIATPKGSPSDAPVARNSNDRPVSTSGSGVQHIRITEEHVGQRVDNFLMRELKGVPRTHVYRIIRRGDVRIDKKRCKPERKLALGELLRVPPYSGREAGEPVQVAPALAQRLIEAVLVETKDFLVINKPSGLAVHAGSGIHLGLIEALRQMRGEWQRAELAHRLDRETSGCLLVAKNSMFLKFAQDQFRAKTVSKRYLALVHGEWPEAKTEVDAPLLKESIGEGERIVRVNQDGKPSSTRFSVETRYSGATLVCARPETGRTHQIRVHCQHAGHAIIGDNKYTQRDQSSAARGVNSLCLHAQTLAFVPSPDAEAVEFEAPLDEGFARVLSQLENH